MTQKFRADFPKPQSDGAVLWYSDWNHGPTLAKITNCRLAGLKGSMRRTVRITDEADTYFSVPAETTIQGCNVRGFVSRDGDDILVFHHCYY